MVINILGIIIISLYYLYSIINNRFNSINIISIRFNSIDIIIPISILIL